MAEGEVRSDGWSVCRKGSSSIRKKPLTRPRWIWKRERRQVVGVVRGGQEGFRREHVISGRYRVKTRFECTLP